MNKKITQKCLLLLAGICILIFLINFLQAPADGWADSDGHIVYYLDGTPVTGWQTIDADRYYFSADGWLCTGWQEIDGNRYCFGDDGRMITGWFAGEHYLHPDGTLATGWLELDGKRYYLGQDGSLKSGLVETDGKTFLLNEQGFLSHGWTDISGTRYYGDENGHPLYGWQVIDGIQHYFTESGALATGWQTIDDFTYYFYTDGAPAQGQLLIDGQTHHFASNGQHLYLVNRWNYLPEDYTVEMTNISDNHQIASIAYEDYLAMMEDCRAAGFEPMVCSSYRTHEYQETLFTNRVERYLKQGLSAEKATEMAGYSVAVPGTSEHQLGLALDIVDNNNWHLDESQAEMPTQKWLMENSWRYGWILRYPGEKSAFTAIIYEPWHYRYVGRTVAAEIHELGLCLEEYLDMLTVSIG